MAIDPLGIVLVFSVIPVAIILFDRRDDAWNRVLLGCITLAG